MAVTRMVETIRDGGAWVCTENQSLFSGYPLNPDSTAVIERTYDGCVLDTYERNGYDDSDFYAVVWDRAERRLRTVQYATTRGWTYLNGAAVDATEDVLAEAEDALRASYLERMRREDEAASRRVEANVEVRLARTIRRRNGRRALQEGERAMVLSVEDSPFRTYYRNGYNRAGTDLRARVMFREDGERWYLSVRDLEVLDPDARRATEEDLAERAERAARQRSWRSWAHGY